MITRKLAIGMVIGAVFGLQLPLVESGVVLSGEQEKESESAQKLATADQLFVGYSMNLAQEVYGYSYSGYEVCCVFFFEKMQVAEVVITDFQSQALGDIQDYGLTIGETPEKYVIDVSPRYFECDVQDVKCQDDYPYVSRATAAYVYEVDKKTLQILRSYIQQ